MSMTAQEIVDELTYINYAHNRQIAPSLTPESFAKAGFPSVPAMEARYQRELADRYAEAKIKRDKEVPEWERLSRTGARDPGIRE